MSRAPLFPILLAALAALPLASARGQDADDDPTIDPGAPARAGEPAEAAPRAPEGREEPGGTTGPRLEGQIRLTTPEKPPATHVIGDGELRQLAAKLDKFGDQLNPTERLMMDWLLQRAASAPPGDPRGTVVHGSFFTPPLIAGGALPGGEADAEDTVALTPSPVPALGRALGLDLKINFPP